MSVDALSLACNIITVIDFGHKFYQSFRDTYENHKPDPNAEAKANDLLLLANKLKISRKKAQQSTRKNDQLFQVADKCAKAATDLHREIAKLALPGASSRAPHGVQSLVSAAKRSWRHNRIEQLKKSLGDCQTTMLTAVLLEMYESGEADQVRRLENFDRLESRLQAFVQAVSRQELRISQLLAESRSLHQETQAVVRNKVAALRNLQISEAEFGRLKASLKFLGQNQRYNDLQPAHSKSFKWLLGHHSEGLCDSDAQDSGSYHPGMSATDSLGPQRSVSSDEGSDKEPYYLRSYREQTFGGFKRWLRYEPDSKLYWVSGKPGAGKSTLMKYLVEQIENIKVMDGTQLVIHHFFWLGTTSSRSKYNDMKGMFMTILRQILDYDLPNTSLAATLMQKIPRIRQKEYATEWSLGELQVVTQEALQLLSSHYSIYVLLDALDEHLPASNHDVLLQTIKQLESMPKVRLVVSSRREKIFERSLSGATQLLLQNLTAPDIHFFALDSLKNAMDFDDSESTEFLNDTVQTIVEKADGVFLWARLAVDSIKRGLIDGNSMDELKDRLNDMPTELSDYFGSIWKRLGDDQKRYQTRAANVFSLLCCRPNDVDRLFGQTKYGPLSHMNGFDLDLLWLSLALNPTYAQVIARGGQNVEKEILFELCENSEKLILSSCAGLVEQQISLDYCIPCNCEPSKLSKRYDFIHRTARDFLRDTEGGKQILMSNDLGEYGPDYRVLLAAVARSVLFREPEKVRQGCLPRRTLNLWTLLYSLDQNRSLLSQSQRYSLLDLCHQVYNQFSGHPQNPIFKNWKVVHPQIIYPFITLAAATGHGDYAMGWMKGNPINGGNVSEETYVMVSKAHFESRYYYNLGTGWPDKPWTILDLKATFEPWDKAGDRLPRCSFSLLTSNPWITTCDGARITYSTLQQILDGLLEGIEYNVHLNKDPDLPFHYDPDVHEQASGRLAYLTYRLDEFVENSDCDLFTTIPLMCISSHEYQNLYPDQMPLLLRHPALDIQSSRTPRTETDIPQSVAVAPVNMIFETSPLWVIGYVRQWYSSVPKAESLCHVLTRLLHSHGHHQELQKPRPILLFTDDKSYPRPTGSFYANLVVREMKKVPPESQVHLGEPDEDGTLKWPLRQIWEELGTDTLDETQIEEILVAHKVWCSEAELRHMLTRCDIRIADEDAPDNKHGDIRFIVPPEGCSAEEERLSYLTMSFHH